MGAWTVPVAGLVAVCDPFTGWEWDCQPVSREDVALAIQEGRLQSRSWQDQINDDLPESEWVRYHAERIAYLVVNPDEAPIAIEIEAWPDEAGPGEPKVVDGHRLRIVDGLHRVAAASMRGDAEMVAWMQYGDEAVLTGLLPGATGLPNPVVGRP